MTHRAITVSVAAAIGMLTALTIPTATRADNTGPAGNAAVTVAVTDDSGDLSYVRTTTAELHATLTDVARDGDQVVAVAGDGTVHADTLPGVASSDPLTGDQWALKFSHFNRLPARADGTGITVAVIDSGVTNGHEDLTGTKLDGGDYTKLPLGDPGALNDPYGHGTHVTGIIAANPSNNLGIAGAAPGATVLEIKVLNEVGQGSTYATAYAVTDAVNSGAKVINLSLGTTGDNSVLRAAVADAIAHGVIVVAAAGNSGLQQNEYPAAYPGVISVASIQGDGSRSWFSTMNSNVAIAAPGDDIASTWNTSIHAYAHLSGTSMATPYVVAAVADLWSAWPAATPAQVTAALLGTAIDAGDPGRDNEYGAGLLDARAALINLDATFGLVDPALAVPDPAPTPNPDPYGTPTTTVPAPTPTPAPTPATAGLHPITPIRLFDTRDPNVGLHPVTSGRLAAGGTVEVPVSGLTGMTATPAAVSLNVTVTDTNRQGYITVYPCGDRPLTSSLNHDAGQTIGNAVIAPVSTNGTICLYTLTAADLVVDVNGWFPDSGAYHALTPSRLFDTRDGSGSVSLYAQPFTADDIVQVRVTGRSGLPSDGIAALSLNITATGSTRPGYVTVYPCGDRPLVSSLNFAAGQTVANSVIAPVSPTGMLCFVTNQATHLIVDVNGWFAPSSNVHLTNPARMFDTRDGTVGLTPVTSGPLTGGQYLEVPVAAATDGANNVTAVVLNVAVTGSTRPGFVTAYPCGDRPLAASVNYAAGATVSNGVIAPVSAAGTVCLYSMATTDIVVDINGWFAS